MNARYLTVRQAGDYMSKSPMAVYHMIRRKQLVPIYVTEKSIRIDREEIDRMMIARTH